MPFYLQAIPVAAKQTATNGSNTNGLTLKNNPTKKHKTVLRPKANKSFIGPQQIHKTSLQKRANLRKISIILLIVLLSSPFYLNIQLVHANEPATLADAINNVVSNIQATDAWTAVYNQIFDLQNQSAFDNAILQAYAQNDSLDVFFIARLAELNNYTSQVINDTLYATLEQGVPYFTMYDRYMVSAYQYAQEFNVSGWNITALYSEVTGVYPALYLTGGGFGRYYDEYAESLSMLLELDKAGLDTTAQMAVDWLSTQNLWNNPVSGNAEINEATGQPYANAAGGFYRYSFGDPICECEMGNFAQIITEYQEYAGTIPYFDRVITDLQTKLLVDGFSSPAWGTVGVIQHATSNSQLRLGETMGVLIALQMLYPYLSQDMQCIFAGMLQSGMWQGLLASSLYNNGQFKFLSTDTGYSSDASSLAAMMMFLDGIVPDTGYLAINASNEAYQDYRTCFPTSEWSFNYHDQSIQVFQLCKETYHSFSVQRKLAKTFRQTACIIFNLLTIGIAYFQ